MTDLERLELVLRRVQARAFGSIPPPDGMIYLLPIVIEELQKENANALQATNKV
jgi:hypothetical protein